VTGSSFTGGTVTGGDYVGGIVGTNGGTVTGGNSTNTTSGTVTGASFVGGVVGYNDSGTVNNWNSAANVTGTVWDNGGVVGWNSGTVQYCTFSGAIEGAETTGGVVGKSKGTVEYCSSTGSVTGNGENAGGVLGYNFEGGIVENCFFTGNTVEGLRSVGGVVGKNEDADSIVKNCYVTDSTIRADDINVGGVVGLNSSIVEYCYYIGPDLIDFSGYGDSDIYGETSIGGVVGANEDGIVQYCYAKDARIKSNSSSAGGVVGYGNGTVQYCYAQDNYVKSEGQSAGGVMGYNIGWLANCYSSGGKVEGDSHSGGVVGKMSVGASSVGKTVQYCYSTSEVSVNGFYVGGILGELHNNSTGTVLNNVALNIKVTGNDGTGAAGRRIGRVAGGVTNAPNNANFYSNYARKDFDITNNSTGNYKNNNGDNIPDYDGGNTPGYYVAAWWNDANNWVNTSSNTPPGIPWNQITDPVNGNRLVWNIVDNCLPTLNYMPKDADGNDPVQNPRVPVAQ